MTKKFEHFVHAMDLTPGKNLVWDFIDCKVCYKASLDRGTILERAMGKKAPKFKLCNLCEKELDRLKEDK